MSVVVKQNDTLPALEATLTDSKGTALNLTNCTVKFIMALAPGEATKGGSGVIISASKGEVAYYWNATDTAEVGEYQGEFQVTYPDGKILTVPNGSYISVEIVADLGS